MTAQGLPHLSSPADAHAFAGEIPRKTSCTEGSNDYPHISCIYDNKAVHCKKYIGIGERMIAKSKSHVKLRISGFGMPSGVFPMSQSDFGRPSWKAIATVLSRQL